MLIKMIKIARKIKAYLSGNLQTKQIQTVYCLPTYFRGCQVSVSTKITKKEFALEGLYFFMYHCGLINFAGLFSEAIGGDIQKFLFLRNASGHEDSSKCKN